MPGMARGALLIVLIIVTTWLIITALVTCNHGIRDPVQHWLGGVFQLSPEPVVNGNLTGKKFCEKQEDQKFPIGSRDSKRGYPGIFLLQNHKILIEK